MASSWNKHSKDLDGSMPKEPRAQSGSPAAIRLRIEGGLLMAFGPGGDPAPPRLVASDHDAALLLENGGLVDRQRALAVLEAQQKAPLAGVPNDRWIEAMLGLAGEFEPTDPALLERELEEEAGVSPTASAAG
jgi:hypothetical protein